MWQRIQTVFYILALGALSLLLFFEFGNFSITGGPIDGASVHMGIKSFSHHTTSGNLVEFNTYQKVIMVLVIFLAVMIIGALLSFKDRIRQISLGRIVVIIGFATLMCAIVLGYRTASDLGGDSAAYAYNFEIGAIAIPLAIVFTFLASTYVKKDEALVRSADRIR